MRVFTFGADGGNHLGVVNDVSGLSAEGMQRIAAELAFSETVFSDWRDDTRPPQVRIFTPAAELGFAGHPLVGLAWVYENLGPGGPGSLECPLGTVTCRSAGSLTWVDVVFPAVVAPVHDVAIGVANATPVGLWSVTIAEEYLIAELATDEDVTGAVPEPEAMTLPTYVFHRAGHSVHARFFAPSLGVGEDPATGSAAVAMAHVFRFSGESSGRVTIHQGAEIGAPSRIELEWDERRTAIGGTVAHDGARFLES